MAARSIGKWYRVGEILSLLQQIGCEIQSLPSSMVDDEGHAFLVRYVLNHENGRFVTVTDLSDDDRIPENEVETWLRRLEVQIPLPPIS